MKTLSRAVTHPLTTKSKVKFFGDFRAELTKTIAQVEKELTTQVEHDFILDWIEVGNHDLRIRTRDVLSGSQKIITVHFRYHHDDERYGNVYIEVQVSEHSEKNNSQFLGKYLVTNRKKIVPDVIDMMMRGIRS